MKNLKPIIFIVIVLILTAVSAYPQRPVNGKVVEVIDGKTFVIQMPTAKLTAILQHIETPYPSQPLHQTIKEHLEVLILNKTVEFLPRSVIKEGTIGQLLVRGVDISQQMVRDGAAWYLVPEKGTQSEEENLIFQDNEKQAKAEKRGIWGVENLKPSWEYRAERDALLQKQEQEGKANKKFVKEMQNQKKRLTQRQQISPQIEMWADVGGASNFDKPLGLGDLRTGFNSTLGVGHISTPSVFLDFPTNDFLRKVESRIFYIYKGDKANVEDSVYLVGFITTTKESKFLKSNSAMIIADSQKISLGKPRRFFRQNISSVNELLLYKITRAQLMKIAGAQKISVQLGGYSGAISSESLMYLNNLMNAT